MTIRAFASSFALALCLLVSPRAFAGPDPQCGAHEHVVVERDEDEGSSVKRCACDDGWNADGPGKPCRQVKKGDAKKGDAKGDK